jgi:selenocysteine lyase/cysteine desulfurase
MVDRRRFLASIVGAGSLQTVEALARPVAALEELGAGKPDDERFWSGVRSHFYLPDEVLYLNNGSLGLSHRAVVEAMHRHLVESETVRSRVYAEYPWWGYGPSLDIRKSLASFVGAEADEIALTRNATEGMNTVATGLDLEAGDEVLLTDEEHPGGKSAWYQRARRYGIAVREFELPRPPSSPSEIVERFENALGPRTRVASVSHITTVTGGMLPVKEICAAARRRGVISLVDGAHAIGQIPLDLHDIGCDYYAASPHKWLYAPKGTGLLYCRKGMAQKIWSHTSTSAWDRLELGCERLTHVGTSNLSLLVGLEAALDFHRKLGIERIAAREHLLAARLRELVSRIDGITFLNGPPPTLSAAMVKVALPLAQLGELPKRLWSEHRVWLATADAERGKSTSASIRFSVPIYVRSSDLERAVALLGKELEKLRRA